MKKIPSDSGLVFLVCDDFRQEQGGKCTLLGVYGNTVVVEKDEKGQQLPGDHALPSLAFYLAFSDGDGEFEAALELTDPNGQSLLPSNARQTVLKKSDGWLTIAFKMMPFPVIEGTYTLRLMLDDQQYTRGFVVRLAPPSPSV